MISKKNWHLSGIVASQLPYLQSPQLNKLLFYADFCHFKLYGISISGCRYRAIDKGPVPFNYRSLFDFLSNNDYADIDQIEFSDGKIVKQSLEEEAWRKNHTNGKKIISYLDGFKLLNI